jgi:hypothetical protein
MQEHEDVDDFMWVLQLTDDKVIPPPPPPPLTAHRRVRKYSSCGRRAGALGRGKEHDLQSGKEHDLQLFYT